ncbi:hypothetical protein [Pedobacter foliorum]|uniref:hypothetical protein n=1 Tax=Pedobacter foliorum TaxID=2739058 RepID=UPI001564A3E3|nr:hypothetical protein [Pedobacter foliorum]NRF37742.1 hypothetical protein [Pedobacter foliorum]
MKTTKFPVDFLKRWSEFLLSSRIIPSKDGNFELTDDVHLDIKETNKSTKASSSTQDKTLEMN